MTLKMIHRGYLERGWEGLMWTWEDQRKGSTNGSTFMPLYNGLGDSYVIDPIGYSCINGVLKGHLTISGVTISHELHL